MGFNRAESVGLSSIVPQSSGSFLLLTHQFHRERIGVILFRSLNRKALPRLRHQGWPETGPRGILGFAGPVRGQYGHIAHLMGFNQALCGPEWTEISGTSRRDVCCPNSGHFASMLLTPTENGAISAN